jgi:hypothetical protein
MRPQCGPMVTPLSPETKGYPALVPAPGTYVMEK